MKDDATMNNHMIPQDIKRLSRQRAVEFYKELKTSTPDQLEPGQIWSTRSQFELSDGRRFETDEPRLVVILEGTGHPSKDLEQITVAPVSLETHMAAEFDLIVSKDVSPLGFGFMIEVWNETPDLREQLRKYLGKLPAELIEAVSELYAAQVLGEEVPAKLERWIGLRLMGEIDPRRAFQETEVAAISYLAQAATASLSLKKVTSEVANRVSNVHSSRRVFEIIPVFDRLSRFIGGAAVAYAARTAEDDETYIVNSSEFTLELLRKSLPPYTIYLIVRRVAPKIEGNKCVVTVRSGEMSWQSKPAELRMDTKIEVGNDPSFEPGHVTVVEVGLV